MEIQCEECRTIFNVDGGLIKEGGAKVRCSVCGHVFTAFPQVDLLVSADKDGPGPEPVLEETEDDLVPLFDEDHAPGVRGTEEPLEPDPDTLDPGAFEDIGGKSARRARDERSLGGEAPDRDDNLEYGPESDLLTLDEDVDGIGDEELFSGDMDDIPPERRPSRLKFVIIPLVVLLVLACAVVGIYYWRPDIVPEPVRSFLDNSVAPLIRPAEKSRPADPGTRLLEFSSVSGSFVDSERHGRLFVVRGMVWNRYPGPRSHILIKGDILDNAGKVVRSGRAYAGNTLTNEELKTMPIEEIKKAMNNPDGMARKNFNLPSGEKIPFMIVFESLPGNLSEFTVEPLSSSPGR